MPLGVLGIVEITEHGRVAQRRHQNIAKMAERMLADGVALIVPHQHTQIGLILMDIEVIEPEPRHAFAKLVGRVEVTQDADRRRLPRDVAHGGLEGGLHGDPLVRVRQLIRDTRHGVEVGGELDGRSPADSKSIDLLLHGFRQAVSRSRMKLRLQPSVPAQRLEGGHCRLIGAPGDRVGQGEIARGHRRFRWPCHGQWKPNDRHASE